jgi:reactive chlorine resistance protein C
MSSIFTFLDVRRGEQIQNLGAGVLRYSVAFLLLLFGAFKFFRFEAEAIQPLLTHSPLMAWMPVVLGVRGSSAVIGVVELFAGLGLALGPWWPKLGAIAGLVATATFLTTLSFLVTTPGVLAPGSDAGGFLLKDLVLFGAALHAAGTSILAVRAQRAPDPHRLGVPIAQ